jgi:hypothetical protein
MDTLCGATFRRAANVTEKLEARMHWICWAAVGLVVAGIGVFLLPPCMDLCRQASVVTHARAAFF